MRDSRPLASSSDVIVLAPCPQCGTTSRVDLVMCPACGAHLGADTGQTVLDDVHARETFLLGAREAPASASPTDTIPEVLPADPTRIVISAPVATELPSFAESTDEVDGVTVYKPREPRVGDAPREFGSSSDPPTRFLSNHHKHIELPSGSVVDDYEIEGKLGEGAMGVVYGARHAKLGRRVAIKVIAPTMGSDPQALARFEREARALASLCHPGIVDVYAFGTLADGRSYFAMEHLTGLPLDEALERARVPLDEALDVLDQIARALESAHAQGIVHRDLKPSNIFLVRAPHERRAIVKLLDWGLAKSAIADGVERTASDAMIGTALYLSPEQARSPNVDGRTDVYALGCVAYELVLGQHPFQEARTNVAAIAAHLTEPPPQPRSIWPEIPAALDLLLYSMLAKDPSYRPTLAQVRSVVASVRTLTTAGRLMNAAVVPPRPTLRARAWTVALVALALLVGITIGTCRLGHRSNDGDVFQTSPVERVLNPRGGRETPALDVPEPRVTVLVPVPDAGVTTARAPAPSAAKPARAKPDIPPTIDAAVAEQASPEIEIDVGTKPDATIRSSAGETTSKSKVIKSSQTPVGIGPPKPASQPTRPLGRDDTINPFAKGSAAR
jgi:serine/threonine-protein kinase